MTVKDLTEILKATALTGDVAQDNEVTTGMTCDLLSWVMANGSAGCAWITVQSHMNIIAVATLLEFPCIIIPSGIAVESSVIEKAREEEIALLSCRQNAFELCGLMHDNGLAGL